MPARSGVIALGKSFNGCGKHAPRLRTKGIMQARSRAHAAVNVLVMDAMRDCVPKLLSSTLLVGFRDTDGLGHPARYTRRLQLVYPGPDNVKPSTSSISVV